MLEFLLSMRAHTHTDTDTDTHRPPPPTHTPNHTFTQTTTTPFNSKNKQVGLTPRQDQALQRMRASRSMREFHAELHHFTGHDSVDHYFKVRRRMYTTHASVYVYEGMGV